TVSMVLARPVSPARGSTGRSGQDRRPQAKGQKPPAVAGLSSRRAGYPGVDASAAWHSPAVVYAVLFSLIDLLFCLEIVRGLQAVEARVLPIAFHEFAVAPLFLDAPIGQVHNAVGHAHGGAAV